MLITFANPVMASSPSNGTGAALWAVVLLGILSASATSVVAQVLLTRRRLAVEEQFKDQAREKDAIAARQERLEQAHAQAAQEHTGRVAEIYYLLDQIAWDVLSDEAGVFNPEGSTVINVFANAGQALRLLREVWTSHPTRAVRETARVLYDDVMAFYGGPPPDPEGWPSPANHDVLLRHTRECETLIEILHTVPVATAVRAAK